MKGKIRSLRRVVAAFLLVGSMMASGCHKQEIAFTTGLTKQELFKVDGKSCTIAQANIVLMNFQREYEILFGEDKWSQPFGQDTLEDYVKEQALKQLSQLRTLSVLAGQNKISLSEEEEKAVSSAAEEYMSNLKEHQPEGYKVETKDVEELYRQYCLANQYYRSIIETVDTEISDDEARIITVQHILFKTEKTDENGNNVPLSEEERKSLNSKAYDVWQRALAGENFEDLAVEFSDDKKTQYTFGRGEMEKSFEEAAFDLTAGEMSGLVETKYGIHIIKCISHYDEAQTIENKKVIYQQRCVDALNKEYNSFISDVLTEFNDDVWNETVLDKEESVAQTPDLFGIYRNYLEEAPLDLV